MSSARRRPTSANIGQMWGTAVGLACACLVLLVNAHAQVADPVHLEPAAQPRAAEAAPSSPDLPLRAGFKALKVNVDLVLVPVTVTDGMNRSITGLDKTRFTVEEDGKPQDIEYFSTEDAPISVGLLVDLSGSMANKFDTEREAVSEFFKNAHPDDDYFVITFNRRPQVLADTTQSIGTIQAKLGTATPGGYTTLLDAIYLGLQKLHHARYRRRALVIFSDGGDNASRFRLKEIRPLVEESDVSVNALGIFDQNPLWGLIETTLDKRLLTQVTEPSGGRAIFIHNPADLPQAAASLSRSLREQYVLGYRPAGGAGSANWRKIRVRVNSEDPATRLRAAYKKGYFAPR